MASSARIDELRKKFEENPRRYFAPLANEYRKAGDIEQAISICREYLPQQPGHMSGHIVYGQALYEARQYEEARTVFETALALDPENLIALRQLGDIALIIGDIDGARTWYGRVLEADPRNEEIQGQLNSLESVAPPAAPTPLSTPAVPPITEAAAGTADSALPELQLATSSEIPASVRSAASSAPTVVTAIPAPVVDRMAGAQQPPAPPVQSLSTAPTAEITLDQVPVPAVPDLEKLTPSSRAGGQDDLPVEKATGFEPTAQAAETAVPKATEVETTAAPASASPPLDSFTLEGLETTSMAPSSAAEPTPAPAPVPDLELATAPAEVDTTPPPAAAEAPESGPPSNDLPFLDLGESRAAPPATEPPIADSKPFVTETMAELYEQQGHRDEALRVYRALLEQRPNDDHLRSRIEQLEGKRGPTIRELLSRVAARRPTAAAASDSVSSSAPSAAADVAAAAPDTSQQPAAAASPASDSAAAEVTSTTASATEAPTPRSDALGQLFANPQIAGADEKAAITLAAAFSSDGRSNGGNSGAQLSGAPARPASKDLSLDAVFGTEAGSAPPASSFSFDQFFSERATAEQPAAGRAGGEGKETKDDVAKFTQWLEGLKQR